MIFSLLQLWGGGEDQVWEGFLPQGGILKCR
jgi:hypothetical protein